MSEALSLYGTEAPSEAGERIVVGRLLFTLEGGALRHIRIGETEILRGISFLVRDGDWGTLVPRLDILSREEGQDAASIRMQALYESDGAELSVELVITATPDTLEFQARGQVDGAFETNRAGFTILHPATLAGCPVTIDHSDGGVTRTEFPRQIDPWQPFMDIAGMTHQAEGMEVRCRLRGDTFETEDQRQWGDASYKTYNRPLAKPWPYVLPGGSVLEQSVAVEWQDCGVGQSAWSPQIDQEQVSFPQTALLVSAVDVERAILSPSDIQDVGPRRLLCSVDETIGDVASQVQAFGALQRAFPDYVFDLEAVCQFDAPPMQVLSRLRDAMDASGFAPASIMVCPSVDRQSTPPGSEWPACPPLQDIHTACAAAFPNIRRGGGMATFFPELNRKRPPVELLDFVSHSLCPIVHAADDVSVMETLEAVPHITASARAFIGDRSYHIGPSTIAMRHNPYGQRTIPNPDKGRVCMSDDDPRHFAAFGAAYALGLACALAPAGVAVWTPSELYGPRGLGGPLKEAVTVLAGLAGQPVHSGGIKRGVGTLCVGGDRLIVNLTSDPQHDLPPYGWRKTPFEA